MPPTLPAPVTRALRPVKSNEGIIAHHSGAATNDYEGVRGVHFHCSVVGSGSRRTANGETNFAP